MKWISLLAVLVFAGCSSPDDIGSAAKARAVSLKTEVAFDGYVVPMNAKELRAPQSSFRVGSWSSQSGWIKLVHLAEDGAEVKKGDVVAKFEFPGDNAREYVEREIRNAEVQRDQAGLSQQTEVDTLVAEEERKRLEAEQARLDTLRRGVISERDWELSKLTYQQAMFDTEATAKHRKAVKRALSAEANYQDRNVDRAQALQNRFDAYKKLFQVTAANDGVLRHAFHRRRGRKVQKGDGMPAGMHFASLAEDKQVWVQFFVPESMWGELDQNATYVVEAQSAGGRLPVQVDKIEEFPQELGFLKGDDGLPNAREKAYVVWARFEQQPEQLSAGVEVRVRKR